MALVIMALSSSVALAAPGDLDASFGAGGKQTLNFGGADRATHVAITPDAGSSLLVRWSRAPGAVRYGVLVNRSGGSQQRFELSARQQTLRIRHYPLTEGGRVSVSARGILGDWGGSRQSRPFKATKLATTALVTHPFKHKHR